VISRSGRDISREFTGAVGVTLPPWAVVTPERRAHVERVAALITTWATAMRVPERERGRWLSAAWLHDALRDAPAANELAHGPLAAERAAHDGLTDQGVLDAVRYHSLGFAPWDDVGRMPVSGRLSRAGASVRPGAATLARGTGAPGARRDVEAGRRPSHRARDRGPLAAPRETVDFWNALIGS